MGAVIIALIGALMIIASIERVGDELVVVLPSADGHVGMVVVERKGERAVLNQAYAASRIVGGSPPQAQQLSIAEVRNEFAGTLAALPERPKSFLVYFQEGNDELTEDLLGPMKDRVTPDKVTPLVVYLCSEQNQETHAIYSVGGGRYARIFIGLGQGWTKKEGDVSVEDIQAHFAQIHATDGYIIPQSIADEMKAMMQAFSS